MSQMNNRDKVLDITKAFGIIFMVLGHMQFSDAVFNKYVYAFHMPLFFIISGMLFNENKSIRSMLRSRFKSLMVPYIWFGGGYSAIYMLKCILQKDTPAMLETVKAFLLTPTENFHFESAMWFLPVMFLTSIGYCLIRKKLTIRLTSIVVAVIGIIGFALPHLIDFRLPWGIDTACVAILFFHIGWLIKHLMPKVWMQKEKHPLLFWLSFIALATINTVLIFANKKFNMRVLEYGNPILSIANAVCATLLWMIIAHSVMHLNRFKELLCRISELSIVFLCINHGVIRVVSEIVGRVLKNNMIAVPIIFVICMACMLAIGEIITRTKVRFLIGRG